MNSEKVILDSDAEAAFYMTGISGWVSSTGRYFGEYEDAARYDGCTHKKCESCGNIYKKNSYCKDCQEGNEKKRYDVLNKEVWDEESIIYSESADTYFNDIDELYGFIVSEIPTNDLLKNLWNIDSLRLLKCQPVYIQEIDPTIFYREYYDEYESNIPSELMDEIDKLNKFINEGKFILCYRPLDTAIILSDDSLDKLQAKLESANFYQPVPKTESSFEWIEDFCANQIQTEWIVRGYLEQDCIAVLFGDSKAGKSFIAIDLACHVAHGLRWNNRKTKEGTVVYIAGEGANGLSKRFKAWHVFHGKEFKNTFISIVPFKLCEASQVKELIQHIKDILGETKPVMIIIDDLNRNFSANGGDENSTKDMSNFLDGCSQLRIETNACVIVIHHIGHNNKERGRGSSALFYGVDFEYLIEKTGEVKNNDCKSTITATRVKYHAKPEPIALKWNIQDTGWEEYNSNDELVPITSIVLTPTENKMYSSL